MDASAEDYDPSDVFEQGRADLAAWEEEQPDNFFETDPHLQNILECYWGADRMRSHTDQLSDFGHVAATVIDLLVRTTNQPESLPKLERFTPIGDRVDTVRHSLEHYLAGQQIYGSGAMAVYGETENNLLALALFYLSSYNGEAGHNCPLACTAGVIKTLQFVADDELRELFLPSLLDPDGDTLVHGAQFLTEVQGGSDVGANACTASLLDEDENLWLINGEKWFCSNVTADLILVTARPDGAPPGTKGLGLYLVPRTHPSVGVNGIFIRRLKDKIGTRSMATGEVDLVDAVAYEIGAPGKGFQHAMDYVINTSRLYNAVGSAGAARRAYVIAWTYAQHRRAFGHPIYSYPLVQEALTEMRSITMAITSGSLYLAHLRDRIETGRASGLEKNFFRMAINLNKYRSSILATDCIRRAIELLGGNGAMENFSVLPRLLRDSIVFEAWEGAHNTLLAQTARDILRHKLHESYCGHLHDLFFAAGNERGAAAVAALHAEIDGLAELEETRAALLLKPIADRMIWQFYVACLSHEARWEETNGKDLGKPDIIDWLWHRFVEPSQAADFTNYLKQISQISAVL
jgi:hypothetical protein